MTYDGEINFDSGDEDMTHDRDMKSELNFKVHSGKQEVSHDRAMNLNFGEQRMTRDRMRTMRSLCEAYTKSVCCLFEICNYY